MTDTRDVFISYRRDGGSTVARMLAEILKSRGVSVFFDVETLESGDFTQQIVDHIKGADKLVLIVSPLVFDRCQNEDDWVRKEIELALSINKTIIPVFVNGVSGFPDDLPQSISQITKNNGIFLGHDNYEDSILSLISQIKTRKDQMIDAFFDLGDRTTIEELQENLETFQNLFGHSSSEWNKMHELIYTHFKRSFKSKKFKSIDDLSQLFDGYDMSLIDELCDKLSIDGRGSKKAKLESINAYIHGEELARAKPNDKEELEDRFFSFLIILEPYLKDFGPDGILKGLRDEHKCRTNLDALIEALEEDEGLARLLERAFYVEKIKELHDEIFPNEITPKTKQEIFVKIENYIDYKD